MFLWLLQLLNTKCNLKTLWSIFSGMSLAVFIKAFRLWLHCWILDHVLNLWFLEYVGQYNHFFEFNFWLLLTPGLYTAYIWQTDFLWRTPPVWSVGPGHHPSALMDSVAARMAMVTDSPNPSLKSRTTVTTDGESFVSTASIPCDHFLSANVISVGKCTMHCFIKEEWRCGSINVYILPLTCRTIYRSWSLCWQLLHFGDIGCRGVKHGWRFDYLVD